MEELETLISELEASFSTAGDTELGSLKERTEKYSKAKADLDAISERWLELAEKEEQGSDFYYILDLNSPELDI